MVNVKEYRRVVEFCVANRKYVMYLDNNNKHFFLRKDDIGNLHYITGTELMYLCGMFNKPRTDMISKDKIKCIPKIILSSGAIVLTLSSMDVAHEMYLSKLRTSSVSSTTVNEEQNLTSDILNNYVSTDETKEESKALEVDTYLESDSLKYVFVYDNDYLDKIFPKMDITEESLDNVVRNNSKINNNFKNLLYEYIHNVMVKYPDIDLRPFYKNLETLEVVECTDQELVMASLSIDSKGCYNRLENKIYVLKDKEYVKGTWDYQVIYHELSHALRTCRFNENGYKYQIQIEGQNYSNTIINESLNSLFAVSLFDYNEDDIAYQLQSNYMRVVLSCLDNYSLSDYATKSTSYFAKKLDEYNKQDNYATVILDLIQFQYDDFHDDRISVSQSEYYPIYDYICNMYFAKYIKDGMSYDEAYGIYEDMISTIMFDVPEDYNVDVNRFYENFKNYCDLVNIKVGEKTR